MTKLELMFEKVYVINLKHRSDRLKAFFDTIEEKGWPFKRPEVWEAVPGGNGKVPCPIGFTQGGGAFGCRQSHVGILQHCLMHDIKSVLVLEDDATIMSSFADDVQAFIELVPDDWQGIMLGGQHHHQPTKLRAGLVKVNYAQRTQAYACRGEYMRGLYARWAMATVHIDWLMNGWQSNFKVYAPERWLIGQARSNSDICGRSNAATFWNPVTNEGPVILLKTPKDVMQVLRDQYGLHTGYTRDADDVDVELSKTYSTKESASIRNRLQKWIGVIQYECGQTEDLVCTVWHPEATIEQIKSATKAPVIEITAESLESALAQIPEGLVARREISNGHDSLVLLLDAPQSVAAELRDLGFHFGNWRDPATDIDNGLRAIFDGEPMSETDQIGKLREWAKVLRDEARCFGGIVTARHPRIKREHLEAAGQNVIEICADDLESALEQWRERSI